VLRKFHSGADVDAPADVALAQLDDTQSELEAGNAVLLQDATFLIPMLASQATGAAVHPVSLPLRLNGSCEHVGIFNVYKPQYNFFRMFEVRTTL